jgi:hypothetical protein
VNLFGRHPSLPASHHTAETRFQQVDGELTGDHPLYGNTTLQDICWRRDGVLINPDDVEANNKVVRLHLQVGQGTYENFSANFGANFESDPRFAGPTVVMGYGNPNTPASMVYQPVNLPDYRLPENVPPGAPQTPMPAMPFLTANYTIQNNPYNADYNSFIWSLCVEGATTGCYPLDAHQTDSEFTISGEYGVGCVNNGHSFPMALHVDGVMDPTVPKYDLIFDVDFAPPSPRTLQVFVVAGTAPQNIPFAGLCTNLYAPMDIPALSLANWTTNTSGGLLTNGEGTNPPPITIPWTGSLLGTALYFQAFCWDNDPGRIYPIAIAASNGVAHQFVEANPLVKSIISWDKNGSTAPMGVQNGLGIVTILN